MNRGEVTKQGKEMETLRKKIMNLENTKLTLEKDKASKADNTKSQVTVPLKMNAHIQEFPAFALGINCSEYLHV